MYYQPQVEAQTGRVRGAEALLRWHHPELGVLGPRTFLELAESDGVARDLAAFTLQAACEQVRGWMDGGYPDVRLAVNLAPGDVRDPGLPGAIEGALAACGSRPSGWSWRCRRRCWPDEATDGLRSLAKLRDAGLRVSLDECGLLPAWRRMMEVVPADAVKVNASLVRGLGRDERETAAVAAVLEAAEAAGMETVGSGVETQHQLDALRRQNCGRVQGYYYSQALPAADFGQILRDGVLPDVDPRRDRQEPALGRRAPGLASPQAPGTGAGPLAGGPSSRRRRGRGGRGAAGGTGRGGGRGLPAGPGAQGRGRLEAPASGSPPSSSRKRSAPRRTCWSVAAVEADEVDRLNVYRAAAGGHAAARCTGAVSPPDYVLVDARTIPDLPVPQRSIVGGDALCHAIAAASILAKCARDAIMVAHEAILARLRFRLAQGLRHGRAQGGALRRLGPCPIHRRSFTPCVQSGLFDGLDAEAAGAAALAVFEA